MAIINKPSDYFNTKLYAGNGSSQALTGVGFQPDFTWIKSRTDTRKHNLYDVVRGVQKRIVPNDTAAEDTVPGVTAFGADGFTVGSETDTNGSSRNFVGWSWKAGTSFSNSAGANGATIASTGSVNQDAGFSIVSYNSNGVAGATVGHGLGSTPKMIIVRRLNPGGDWYTYHASLGATKSLGLSETRASITSTTIWNDTEPTSSVFSLGTNGDVNSGVSSYDMIAYCFAEKQGYSKFGSYTGNGDADGTFVYTGFKPAFIMVKRSNGVENWTIMDNTRDPFNVAGNKLHPNTTGGTDAGATIDILSNGFKNRTTNAGANGSGDSYIFYAIAENPFVTSTGNGSIPATAR